MAVEKANEIYCHVPTLLSPVTLPLLGLPVEGLVRLGSAIGYDGLEWRPMRSVAENQLRMGFVTDYAKRGIKSAEQSYRGERTWQEASQHPNKRLAQISYILFPHRQDSLHSLVRLQSLAGEIPTTVYPTSDPIEAEQQRSLTNKLIQISPECMEIFGVTSFEGLIQHMVDNGIGINLDIMHYRRLAQSLQIPADNVTFRSALPYIKEVQFPVARDDFGDPGGDTSNSYEDLANGTRNNENTRLLLTLLERGYEGPIVPEVNPAAFGTGILKAHKEIVKGLRSFTT